MSGYVTINNQKIAWSFIMKVKRLLGHDPDRLIDCFWKARQAEDVVRYVAAGFLPDKDGNRYSMLPSAERETGQFQRVRDWWRTIYQPKNRPTCLADILRGMARGEQE
jgi:hypothetical protein